MTAEVRLAPSKTKRKAKGHKMRTGETIYVLNKNSESFKLAKQALQSYPQDSLADLTEDEIRAVFSGKTRDEVIAQREK